MKRDKCHSPLAIPDLMFTVSTFPKRSPSVLVLTFFLGHRVRRSVWESKLLAPCFCFQGRLFSPRQRSWPQSCTRSDGIVHPRTLPVQTHKQMTNYGNAMSWRSEHPSSPQEFCGRVRALCTFPTAGSCQEGGNRTRKQKIDTNRLQISEARHR